MRFKRGMHRIGLALAAVLGGSCIIFGALNLQSDVAFRKSRFEVLSCAAQKKPTFTIVSNGETHTVMGPEFATVEQAITYLERQLALRDGYQRSTLSVEETKKHVRGACFRSVASGRLFVSPILAALINSGLGKPQRSMKLTRSVENSSATRKRPRAN
jgi:hypothetical protein